MPCYDPQTNEDHAAARAKVNRLTLLLCGVCEDLEAAGTLGDAGHELRVWYEDHKELDRRLRGD